MLHLYSYCFRKFVKHFTSSANKMMLKTNVLSVTAEANGGAQVCSVQDKNFTVLQYCYSPIGALQREPSAFGRFAFRL